MNVKKQITRSHKDLHVAAGAGISDASRRPMKEDALLAAKSVGKGEFPKGKLQEFLNTRSVLHMLELCRLRIAECRYQQAINLLANATIIAENISNTVQRDKLMAEIAALVVEARDKKLQSASNS